MSIEGEEKFIIGIDTAVHHTVDGTHVEGAIFTNERDPEVLRDTIAEARGMEPEQVIFNGEQPRTRGARLSVGFSKWRSSWDPHAEKQGDPNLN